MPLTINECWVCVCVREREREGEGKNEFTFFLLVTFPGSLEEFFFLSSHVSLLLRHALFSSHFNTLMPGCVWHRKHLLLQLVRRWLCCSYISRACANLVVLGAQDEWNHLLFQSEVRSMITGGRNVVLGADWSLLLVPLSKIFLPASTMWKGIRNLEENSKCNTLLRHAASLSSLVAKKTILCGKTQSLDPETKVIQKDGFWMWCLNQIKLEHLTDLFH